MIYGGTAYRYTVLRSPSPEVAMTIDYIRGFPRIYITYV